MGRLYSNAPETRVGCAPFGDMWPCFDTRQALGIFFLIAPPPSDNSGDVPAYLRSLTLLLHTRDNVTTMDSGAEPRVSCSTRKTILTTSGPISIR